MEHRYIALDVNGLALTPQFWRSSSSAFCAHATMRDPVARRRNEWKLRDASAFSDSGGSQPGPAAGQHGAGAQQAVFGGMMQSNGHAPIVLVVEDELLLASVIAEVLEGEGFSVRGPYPKLSSALNAVDKDAKLDIAFLDVNLRGELVFPLAHRLRELGVPFVFCTGYVAALEFPPELADAPVIAKPFTDEVLRRTAKELLDKRC